MDSRARSWRMPEEAREAALVTLQREVRTAAETFEALCALGALVLGSAHEVAEPHLERLRGAASALRGQLDVGEFSARVDELLARLETEPPEDALHVAGGALPSWADFAERVLAARHRIELTERAWALLWPGESALEDSAARELSEADELLHQELWCLTVLNEHRRAALEAIAPAERSCVWWYAEGAHVHPRAALHLGEVAALAACFPDAREELDALLDAERVLVPPSQRSIPVLREEETTDVPDERRGTGAVAATWSEEDGASLRPSRLARGILGAAVGVAAVALLLLGIGGLVHWTDSEAAEQERAALQEEAARLEADARAQIRRLEAALKSQEELSEAQRHALERELEAARRAARTAEEAQEERAPGHRAGAESGAL